MFFFSSLRCVVCGMCFVHLLGYNNRELRKKKAMDSDSPHGVCMKRETFCMVVRHFFLYSDTEKNKKELQPLVG